MAKRHKSSVKKDTELVTVTTEPEVDEATISATVSLSPLAQGALTLKQYSTAFDDLDLVALTGLLQEQTKKSRDGDQERCEEMLITQAHTLDAIFNNLARRAINADYVDHLETFLKLALRAQSQSRSTWEALNAIKNPPVMGYVKQANITNGPQQVNNTVTGSNNEKDTEKNVNMKNKLLEKNDGERVDTREASEAIGDDSAVETVGAIDRTED